MKSAERWAGSTELFKIICLLWKLWEMWIQQKCLLDQQQRVRRRWITWISRHRWVWLLPMKTQLPAAALIFRVPSQSFCFYCQKLCCSVRKLRMCFDWPTFGLVLMAVPWPGICPCNWGTEFWTKTLRRIRKSLSFLFHPHTPIHETAAMFTRIWSGFTMIRARDSVLVG